MGALGYWFAWAFLCALPEISLDILKQSRDGGNYVIGYAIGTFLGILIMAGISFLLLFFGIRMAKPPKPKKPKIEEYKML